MAKQKQKADPHGGSWVEFDAGYLRDRLSLFRSIVVKRASRKDLASYHFTVKSDGSCIVAGTDLENRLQVKLGYLRRWGYGVVMIDTQALNAMMGGYAEQKVRLHLDDPTKVQVEGLQTKLVLPGYDPEKELRATAEGSLTKSGWMVRGDYLATAIEKTRFAVEKDNSTRYALAGIAISFPVTEDGEDRAEVVATTGRMLSLYRVPVRPFGTNPARLWRPSDGAASFPTLYLPIIGNKVVPLVLALAREAGPDPIGIAVIPAEFKDLKKQEYGPGTLQVVTKNAVLTCKIPEGRFPRYQDVWPHGAPEAELRLEDASTLGTFLASAWCATDTEHKGVEMVLAGGCLMMTTESETKGKAVISLLVPNSTGRTTFDLDALMLRQFFDAAGNERLWMGMYGPREALVFKAGPFHEFILMPLTRDGQDPVVKAKPIPKAAPAPEPEGEDDGGEPVIPETRPVPVAPVAVSPKAHEGNGKSKQTR